MKRWGGLWDLIRSFGTSGSRARSQMGPIGLMGLMGHLSYHISPMCPIGPIRVSPLRVAGPYRSFAVYVVAVPDRHTTPC
jgi:hypothetical protein